MKILIALTLVLVLSGCNLVEAKLGITSQNTTRVVESKLSSLIELITGQMDSCMVSEAKKGDLKIESITYDAGKCKVVMKKDESSEVLE